MNECMGEGAEKHWKFLFFSKPGSAFESMYLYACTHTGEAMERRSLHGSAVNAHFVREYIRYISISRKVAMVYPVQLNEKNVWDIISIANLSLVEVAGKVNSNIVWQLCNYGIALLLYLKKHIDRERVLARMSFSNKNQLGTKIIGNFIKKHSSQKLQIKWANIFSPSVDQRTILRKKTMSKIGHLRFGAVASYQGGDHGTHTHAHSGSSRGGREKEGSFLTGHSSNNIRRAEKSKKFFNV